MERMSEEQIKIKHLIDEHYARYKIFSTYIKGNVIDCACGIGYASEIIFQHTKATKYIGVDISEECVNQARKTYINPGYIDFKVGTLNDLEFEDESFDTFISMETLEHIEENLLEKSCEEIKRVLKKTGYFIGSVPSNEYDEKCNHVYGVNEYHITRFSRDKLNTLLRKYFSNVNIGVMSRQVSSYFEIDDNSSQAEIEIFGSNYKKNYGSYLFICSDDHEEIKMNNKFFLSQSLVEYDEVQVIPLFNSMIYAEKLALARFDIINQSGKTENKKNKIIDNLTKHITESPRNSSESEIKVASKKDKLKSMMTLIWNGIFNKH